MKFFLILSFILFLNSCSESETTPKVEEEMNTLTEESESETTPKVEAEMNTLIEEKVWEISMDWVNQELWAGNKYFNNKVNYIYDFSKTDCNYFDDSKNNLFSEMIRWKINYLDKDDYVIYENILPIEDTYVDADNNCLITAKGSFYLDKDLYLLVDDLEVITTTKK
tara:strand:- start:690 stop:1190 length:501 start_codon:yes stop_codon:yes gene_type:complete